MADIRSTPEDGWGEATIKTVLMGDFYENPTLTGLGVRAVVSSIPVLDQVADAQDVAAWIVTCRDKGLDSLEVKLGGLLLGIGLIPSLGSLAKGVLKALDSSAGARAVVQMLKNLNWSGQGNGVKWLKEFAEQLPSHAQKAAGEVGKALDKLMELLRELTPHVPASLLAKLDEWMASVAALRASVEKMFKEAAEHYKKKLDDALAKFKKEEFDVDSPSRGEARRVQDSEQPARGAAGGGLADKLPAGSRVVKETDDYVIYQTPDGAERIRFRASEAHAYNEYVAPGRNYSTECEACLTPDGKVMVLEGKHRAVGAAKGDLVPEELGGVPGQSGVLDYEYYNHTSSTAGVPVRDLQVDYTQPELSRSAADAAREEMLRR